MTRTYADIWVCTDCHFAHHYGATEVDGQWYAGESDSPADREPLALIGDEYVVADNTCSDHEGDDETACEHCGQEGYEDGIQDFSWSRCDGCGSTLGGSRYRLAVFDRQ
jgi:ribosomal protein L37AE/L43A